MRAPFLCILASTCYFLSFWYKPFWQLSGDISSWFCFAFPWWFMVLNIFPCACWSSFYLIWKNVCSYSLPIFFTGLFLLLLIYMWSLYILDTNPLLEILFTNIFFILLIISFPMQKPFNKCCPIYLFVLLFPLPLESGAKTSLRLVSRSLVLDFCRGFMVSGMSFKL